MTPIRWNVFAALVALTVAISGCLSGAPSGTEGAEPPTSIELPDSGSASTPSTSSVAPQLPDSGASADSPSDTTAAARLDDVARDARAAVRGFWPKLLAAALVLGFVLLLLRVTVYVLEAVAERTPRRRLLVKRAVPILRILVWGLTTYFIVVVIFQTTPEGLLAAGAAVGVAIGFAAQDILKNIFGGLIVVFDQPFQVGDKIEIAGTYGEVVSIGLRSTKLVTPDDNLVTVPNAQIVESQVANANAGELNCQVVTELYLPGWVDATRARELAHEATVSSEFTYLKKPVVVLVEDAFKETFLLKVTVKAYVLDPRLEAQFQSNVTERARAAFRNSGLVSIDDLRGMRRG